MTGPFPDETFGWDPNDIEWGEIPVKPAYLWAVMSGPPQEPVFALEKDHLPKGAVASVGAGYFKGVVSGQNYEFSENLWYVLRRTV